MAMEMQKGRTDEDDEASQEGINDMGRRHLEL